MIFPLLLYQKDVYSFLFLPSPFTIYELFNLTTKIAKLNLILMSKQQISIIVILLSLQISLSLVLDKKQFPQSIVDSKNLASKDFVYDYAVLGAGISGLRTAQLLLSQNKSVVILEAQDKVGGKIISLKIKDIPELNEKQWFKDNLDQYSEQTIDLGAAQIDDDHKQVHKLAKKYGLKLIPLLVTGYAKYIISHKVGDLETATTKHQDQVAEFFKKFQVHVDILTQVMDKLRVKYDEQSFQILKKYDSTPAKQFILNDLGLKDNQFLREIILNQLETMLCASMEEIGAVSLMTNFQDFRELQQFFGFQEYVPPIMHIEGGNHRLPKKMFEDVLSKGAEIRFNHEVVKINNQNHQKQIIVHAKVDHKNSSEEVTIKARKVMFGLPQMIGKDIEIVKLSKTKRYLFNAILPSEVIKSFLFVKKPVDPRQKSEQIFLDTKSLANTALKISPVYMKQLAVYLYFHSKRRIPQFQKLSKQEKKEYLINILIKGCELDENDEQLRQAFKESVHVQYNVADNRFLKSAYSTVYGLNFYTKVLESGATLNELDSQEYGISFISSQFSRQKNGYMEGALYNAKKTFSAKQKKLI